MLFRLDWCYSVDDGCVVADVDVDFNLDVSAYFDIDVDYADGKVSVVDYLNEKSPMMGPLHVHM